MITEDLDIDAFDAQTIARKLLEDQLSPADELLCTIVAKSDTSTRALAQWLTDRGVKTYGKRRRRA